MLLNHGIFYCLFILSLLVPIKKSSFQMTKMSLLLSFSLASANIANKRLMRLEDVMTWLFYFWNKKSHTFVFKLNEIQISACLSQIRKGVFDPMVGSLYFCLFSIPDAPDGFLVSLEHFHVVHVWLPIFNVAAVITGDHPNIVVWPNHTSDWTVVSLLIINSNVLAWLLSLKRKPFLPEG